MLLFSTAKALNTDLVLINSRKMYLKTGNPMQRKNFKMWGLLTAFISLRNLLFC